MNIMLDKGAYMPVRGHETDAGLDLRAMETKYVYAGEQAVFDTGVHVEVPKGCVGLITSKSGLMSKGITSRGTIDESYRGSIKAVLFNDSDESYLVRAGDKITQLVIIPIVIPEITVVESLSETERGDGGFGSTGK